MRSTPCRPFGHAVRPLLAMLLAAAFGVDAGAAPKPMAPRRVVNLDGVWEVEQGSMETIPEAFGHTVRVPGLIDMATPGFRGVGEPSEERDAFWLRRTFVVDGELPEITRLKVHKAKYGTRVYLNGKLLGDHTPCFTPGVFDVASVLRGGGETNELVVRLGAHRDAIPQDTPTGWDFEKLRYIPGIYDSVELIFGAAPFVENVQVVPDIEGRRVRVLIDVSLGEAAADVELDARVLEASGGRVVSEAKISGGPMRGGERRRLDCTLPIDDCRLWSPEDPFLYRLELKTAGDAAYERFGMRTFRIDPVTKRPMLNGEPYYLRGSNVTLLRFFEDDQRGELPWDREWVRNLHRKFKTMHWNSLRYCIGFPPEFWYDIADEEGFLIQDEFPIWLLYGPEHKPAPPPEHPVAEKLIPQYEDWMRERWNHPCVVIWDAQNESLTAETGYALQAVRKLDYSNRPWDNGWGEPQSPTDMVESHPYFYIKCWDKGDDFFDIAELADHNGVPRLLDSQKARDVPIVVNEYCWLWLDREGNPTALDRRVYDALLPNSTVEQRRRLWAERLAGMTEFWRAKRKCAGVLHFCGLGYSRPGDKPFPLGGATSDHFLDVAGLEFEPNFESYLRDAFNPLGIMVDFWREEVEASASAAISVSLTNDLTEGWAGVVTVSLERDGATVIAKSADAQVEPLSSGDVAVEIVWPDQPGVYELRASLTDSVGTEISSRRTVRVN